MRKFTLLLLLILVWSCPLAGQSQQAVRTAEGFVLAIPSGWKEAADLGGAVDLTRSDGTQMFVSVRVRQEPANALVSDVLSRFVGKMRADGSVTVLNSRFGTFLSRRAAFAEIEDDGARFRLVLIPKLTGEMSQDYFLLMGWTAAAGFAAAQPEFDRVFAGFEVTAPVTAPAAAATQRGPVDRDARSAFFDRVLVPREGPAGVTPAAESHRRGLEFARQGAWREAESAFHDAERKDNKVPEYKLSAAFAYLKTHKPNDAYKRYEDFYKKDPADARALAGMIAAREEAQLYRDAVILWMRYVRLPHQADATAEANAMLEGARDLFAARYEVAENPTGGAPNLASPDQELSWGLEYAKELANSGLPLLTDPEVVAYVEQLCQSLVDKAKQFPTNYQLFILDTAGVNATTVPGFIFVYRGLLDAAQSEAALAGVLAHEIGHSVAHHSAKKITKAYQDQKQLESLKASDSKLSQFLAKMLEAGNPVGAMSFSREAEEQADRLAVHISFDAGFDPVGLTEMFQQFEQMSPSSRNAWDEMMRTHPFSINRINAVREYAALLPARPPAQTSASFTRMKTRLSALPPAPDATGAMKAPAPGGASKTSRPAVSTVPYSLAPAPFVGQMPEGWTARKHSAQTTVFNAPAGTPEAEASIWIRLAPRAQQPTWTIEDFLRDILTANAKLTDVEFGEVDERRTEDGRQIRILPAAWTGKTTAGAATPLRGLFVLAEFPDYIGIGQYAAPRDYFERLAAGFDIIWNSLRYGTPPPATAPAPSPAPSPSTPGGRITFTIESPSYVGEMPEGWVARRDDKNVVIIEGAPRTEPYEMTIRILFYDKTAFTLDSLATEIKAGLAKLPGASVSTAPVRTTQEGRPTRVQATDYTSKDSTGREVPFKQLIAIVEYPAHLILFGYLGPASLFDKYSAAFELVGSTLRAR